MVERRYLAFYHHIAQVNGKNDLSQAGNRTGARYCSSYQFTSLKRLYPGYPKNQDKSTKLLTDPFILPLVSPPQSDSLPV